LIARAGQTKPTDGRRLDIIPCVLAQALTAALRQRLPGYAKVTPTPSNAASSTPREIHNDGNTITIRLNRRAYSPVLRQADLPTDTTVPHLTGLITCPACGNKYIGTAAHGRNRAYRYYTCFTRSKYGPAGCKSARLNADATDNAVLQALADFYATADTILARVIATAQEQFHEAHTDRRAELATITAQIKQTEAAIDRYHSAFEAGTMDDATAGPRIKDLRHKITQLTARHQDLTDALTAHPGPPPPGTLDYVRTYLRDLITTGSPGERKRAIEALIHEIRITDDGNVIPVFKIPTTHDQLRPPKQREPTTVVVGSRNASIGGPGRTRTDDTRGVNASPLCFCVLLVALSSIFAGYRAVLCWPVRLGTTAAKPSVHTLCTPQDHHPDACPIDLSVNAVRYSVGVDKPASSKANRGPPTSWAWWCQRQRVRGRSCHRWR